MQSTLSRISFACVPGTSIALVIAACSDSTRPVPQLLRGAFEGGGSAWGACPARNAEEARLIAGAESRVSLELEARLARSFRVGSGERDLTEMLRAQGFVFMSPCGADASVRSAKCSPRAASLFSSGTIAEIFRQVDREGNVPWANGFVRHVSW
jgi:hypothetical protein